MRYFNYILTGLIIAAAVLTSCVNEKEELPSGVVTGTDEIIVGPEGGIERLKVASRESWLVSASTPWVAISPASGIGEAECILAIDSTLENSSRTAQVRIATKSSEPRIVTVTQLGFGKRIILKEPEVEIKSFEVFEKRKFDVKLTTNVSFMIDKSSIEYSFVGAENISDLEKAEIEADRTGWIELPADKDMVVDLDRKARPRSVELSFKWEMNTVPYDRVAKIRLVPQNPSEDQIVDENGNPTEVILTVTQKAAQKIEDNRAGDSLAVITINEKIQSMMPVNASENMMNWTNVTLWEDSDEDLPSQNAVGRVRSAQFVMFMLRDNETLPREIKHLKYLEALTIMSNVNWQIRRLNICEEICELKYLKDLRLESCGITELPDDFIKLGGMVDKTYAGLEVLSLSSNSFPKFSTVTKVVNEQNFPKLTALNLVGCRRSDALTDLQQASGSTYIGRPIGLHVNLTTEPAERAEFIRMLTWDNLQELRFSYNFLEGELPDDSEIAAALTAAGKPLHYQDSDFSDNEDDEDTKLVGDTYAWLKTSDNVVTFTETDGNQIKMTGQEVLRVLPRARIFTVNLNFLTGSLPAWMLFHPYFVEWGPEILIFNQQEKGRDSNGNAVKFSNVDADKFDYGYYYGTKDPGNEISVPGVAYPLYYRKYVENESNE